MPRNRLFGHKGPNPVDIEVGQRIRVYRHRAKLSQTQLGDALNVTFQQVQKYEKGVNRVAPSRLELIARACGVPVSAFMPSLDTQKGDVGPLPFAELRIHGAQELLVAYGRIKNAKMRSALVAFVNAMISRGWNRKSPPIVGAAVVPGLTVAYTDKLEWFGTVRGRIGSAFDRLLPYVTGGWAYGHGTISGTGTTTPAGTVLAFSASQDYSGCTIGGGVEWAFMDRWSVKAKYLYINFGAGTLAILIGKMTDNIARLGINYKF